MARRLAAYHVTGTPTQIGEKLGKKFAPLGKTILNCCRKRYRSRGIPWDTVLKQALQFLPYAESYTPSYVETIRGYSRSSGLPFEDLFASMCGDEKGMCTDILLGSSATVDGSVMSAHTEDWREEDQNHLALVKVQRRGFPAFLAMTFGGLEVIGGVNSSGIGVSVNSLSPNDIRVGVPRSLVAYEVLSRTRVDDAVGACVPDARASGYSYNICSSSGILQSVECSATDFAVVTPSNDFLVHTNHYLDKKMQAYETFFSTGPDRLSGYSSSTIFRYNRATRLVKGMLGAIDVERLSGILKDHVNYPDSICAHINSAVPESARTKTIFSEVVDYTNLRMWIGLGNPCEARFESFEALG